MAGMTDYFPDYDPYDGGGFSDLARPRPRASQTAMKGLTRRGWQKDKERQANGRKLARCLDALTSGNPEQIADLLERLRSARAAVDGGPVIRGRAYRVMPGCVPPEGALYPDWIVEIAGSPGELSKYCVSLETGPEVTEAEVFDNGHGPTVTILLHF